MQVIDINIITFEKTHEIRIVYYHRKKNNVNSEFQIMKDKIAFFFNCHKCICPNT